MHKYFTLFYINVVKSINFIMLNFIFKIFLSATSNALERSQRSYANCFFCSRASNTFKRIPRTTKVVDRPLRCAYWRSHRASLCIKNFVRRNATPCSKTLATAGIIRRRNSSIGTGTTYPEPN